MKSSRKQFIRGTLGLALLGLAGAAGAQAAAADAAPLPKELGGRKGPEPVRYGDWEKKGIAVDF